MNYKRIRPGAIVAISVGVLTALTVVFTSSGCQEALTAPGVGNAVQTREALEILPSDAGMVGMMNLAAARESNALDAATGGAGLGMMSSKGSADFDRFVQMTGFDPAKDLDRVYVAMPAGDAEHHIRLHSRVHEHPEDRRIYREQDRHRQHRGDLQILQLYGDPQGL